MAADDISIGALYATITANSESFEAAMKRSEDSLESLRQKVDPASARLKNFVREIDVPNAGSSLLGISAAIGGITLAGRGLQRAAGGVQSIARDMMDAEKGVGDLAEAALGAVPALGEVWKAGRGIRNALQDSAAALAKLRGESNDLILDKMSPDSQLAERTKNANYVDQLIDRTNAKERDAEINRLQGREREIAIIEQRYQKELDAIDKLAAAQDKLLLDENSRRTAGHELDQQRSVAGQERRDAIDALYAEDDQKRQNNIDRVLGGLQEQILRLQDPLDRAVGKVIDAGGTDEEIAIAERRVGILRGVEAEEKAIAEKKRLDEEEIRNRDRLVDSIKTSGEQFSERFKEIVEFGNKGLLTEAQQSAAETALIKSFRDNGGASSFAAVLKGESGTSSVISRNRQNAEKLLRGNEDQLLTMKEIKTIMESVHEELRRQGTPEVVNLGSG